MRGFGNRGWERSQTEFGNEKKQRRFVGFTLIELLVVLGVIAVLAALTIPTVNTVRKNGHGTAAIHNMRQIGVAIHSYVADHDGMLPGPLWPGQMPLYDPNRAGRLVREVARYLDLQPPKSPELVPLFIPPAYRNTVGDAALPTARTFVMNMEMQGEGGVINPWGALSEPPSDTMPLVAVPHSEWGFSDADQQHPHVADAPWKLNTPEKPIHGERRLAWFFDGRVEKIDHAELLSPTP